MGNNNYQNNGQNNQPIKKQKNYKPLITILTIILVISLVAAAFVIGMKLGKPDDSDESTESVSSQKSKKDADNDVNGEDKKTDSNDEDNIMVVRGLDLAIEEYGIAFREGSDIVDEVNRIIKELYEDGTLEKIAEDYDLKDNLCEVKETASRASGESDLEYVKEKGKLVIGYTVYAPMNYTNEKGEFVGFDTELAKAVCEKLGVEPEFVEINWDTKEMELDSKNNDCIWNGFTITEEREKKLDFSVPYISFEQVIVIRSSDADQYKNIKSLKDANIVTEENSYSFDVIQYNEDLKDVTLTVVQDFKDAIAEVKSGAADAAILDYTKVLKYFDK